MRGRLRWTNVLSTLVVVAIVAVLVQVVLVTRKDPLGVDTDRPMTGAGVSVAGNQVWVSGGLLGAAAIHPTTGSVRWQARNLVSGYTAAGNSASTPIELPIDPGEWLTRSVVVRGSHGLAVVGTMCVIPEIADTTCDPSEGRTAAWRLNKTSATPIALQGPITLLQPSRAPTAIGTVGDVTTLVDTVERYSATPTFEKTLIRLDLRTGKSRAIAVPGLLNGPSSICLAGRDLVVGVPEVDAAQNITGFHLMLRGVTGTRWRRLPQVSVAPGAWGGIDVTCQAGRALVGVGTVPTQAVIVSLPTGHVIKTSRFSLSAGEPEVHVGPPGGLVLAVPIYDQGVAERAWYLNDAGRLTRIRVTPAPEGTVVQPAVVVGHIVELSTFDPNGRPSGRPGKATVIR
ncbi:MAG TPA: hypothetical protein VGM93_09065 [Acidimicrobiales bacterium]|jgi:hypothetical protein